MSFNIERGRQGEQAAAEYLLEHGFEILHRNWRSGHYELDIVAVRDGVLHVVEVKCRKKGTPFTAPEEALTPAKQRSLLRAAAGYAALLPHRKRCPDRPCSRRNGRKFGVRDTLCPRCGHSEMVRFVYYTKKS
ncbi:MAG: YraN family protein [Alistipes putredinis]|nr:MAG: YraN family protein [Alistipes putredinis]